MKSLIALIAISLFAASAEAQTRKKKQSKPRPPATRKPAPSVTPPRIIGSQVVLLTKNGDEISGVLLDLSAYSARIKADNLESTISLDTLASISFGSSPATREEQATPLSADFLKDAQAALNTFQALANKLKSTTDYTDFDHSLRDARPIGEQFTARYAVSENKTESHVAALVAASLSDYSWARAIWTMKFGRSGDGTVSDTDSPTITQALNLYTDLRAAAARGSRYSVDMIVAGLWKKAEEKIDRARSLINPAR
jgi:hypothetical protein